VQHGDALESVALSVPRVQRRFGLKRQPLVVRLSRPPWPFTDDGDSGGEGDGDDDAVVKRQRVSDVIAGDDVEDGAACNGSVVAGTAPLLRADGCGGSAPRSIVSPPAAACVVDSGVEAATAAAGEQEPSQWRADAVVQLLSQPWHSCAGDGIASHAGAADDAGGGVAGSSQPLSHSDCEVDWAAAVDFTAIFAGSHGVSAAAAGGGGGGGGGGGRPAWMTSVPVAAPQAHRNDEGSNAEECVGASPAAVPAGASDDVTPHRCTRRSGEAADSGGPSTRCRCGAASMWKCRCPREPLTTTSKVLRLLL
jgi:hypothetical protein